MTMTIMTTATIDDDDHDGHGKDHKSTPKPYGRK